MLADTTSDIDVEAFEKSAEDALLKHRRALAQLNIDSVEVATPSLESLWKTLETRMPKKSAPSASSTASVQTDNSAIWNAICNGDFTRKHQLSQLSPSAARCLAGWKGKDLYLNELTELSPEAARELSAWEGNWLGLNGLETLTPEAATHLSRWKGRGLSLNGLTRLSPRVVAILSEWQGDQIELVNVKHMAHWENPNTRLFLSEAMQRKLHP
jgi:hypothetical protein